MSVRDYLRVLLHPPHLLRTVAIAIVVGSWLTLYNLGDLILAGNFGPEIWLKLFLNFLTPFVVSNWGLMARQTR